MLNSAEHDSFNARKYKKISLFAGRKKPIIAISAHKCHMLNRILYSWSFQMKFMKLAEGSFHNFI